MNTKTLIDPYILQYEHNLLDSFMALMSFALVQDSLNCTPNLEFNNKWYIALCRMAAHNAECLHTCIFNVVKLTRP